MKNNYSCFILAALLLISSSTFCQISVTDYATGLVSPIGLTIDTDGNLWVAEQGTGNDDSRISIVTSTGIFYPFLINLPSEIVQGDPIGAEHVIIDIDDKLLIVQGEGSDSLSESILVVDPTGFTPGDPPLTRNDIEAVYNIGDFSIAHGGETTNPFRIVLGPNNDWYISDAGFNGVIKRERNSGTLSVFTQLGAVVSTGIVFTGTNFYLGSLTGFPFPTGGAKIYTVDLSGNNSIYQSQLTTIVDLAIDPLDNKLLAIQYGEFGAGFQNNSGALYKIYNSNVDTLIYGLNFPVGMVFNLSGELFITSFADGKILKVTGIPVGVEDQKYYAPSEFVLEQNYPNPFNPSTTIRFEIPEDSRITLKIFNILGEEVRTLVDADLKAGQHEYQFNSTNLASGIYFFSIRTDSFTQTKKMVLIR